ncbi:MAG: TonB-dependent receptor [bacterium]|nr:TonB-dependent receptor [bacterium]
MAPIAFACGCLLLTAAPVSAVAPVIVTVVENHQPLGGATVTLVGPQGRTQTATDEDGDGTLVAVPEDVAGDYQVTIRVAGSETTHSVAVPASGEVSLTYSVDAVDDKLRIAYSGVTAEIIVTARKREEKLQETPVAITAFTTEAIEERSITDLSDVGDFTPNLDFSSTGIFGGTPSEATVFVRGIGQIDNALFADPGVGIYVDGVYLARAQGAVLDLLDVERVEVLRGPQGTLFGKNTNGGALTVTSRKPGGGFGGYVDGIVGGYDRRDVRLKLDLPLVRDQLWSSLAISSANRDGFTASLATGEHFDDVNRDAVHGALRWFATSNVVIDFAADYTRNRGHARQEALIDVRPTPLLEFYNKIVGAAGFPVYDERWLTGDLRLSYATSPTLYNDDVYGVALTVSAQLGSLGLTSISAYRTFSSELIAEADGSPVPLGEANWNQNQHQLSQEVQLSGVNGRLSWLVGAWYFSELANAKLQTIVLGDLYAALEAAPGPIYAPLGFPDSLCNPGPAPPGMPCFGGAGNPANLLFFFGDGNLEFIDLDNDSYAIFGDGTLTLTDRLKLTAGLRYSYEEKKFDYLRDPANGYPDTVLFNQDSWDSLSPKIGLSFQVTPETLLYASVAYGFKSGGFNGRPQDRGVLDAYDPETVLAYEAGFKTDWRHNRLRLNGALFFSDYKDIQYGASLVDEHGNPVLVTQNAGEAEIRGFELELEAWLSRGLSLFATVGHTDPKYTKVNQQEPLVASLDSTLPKTPAWNGSAAIQYAVRLPKAGELRARLDYSYRTKVYNDIANTPQIAQDAYGLLNARLSYTPTWSSWELALFGTNLTDEEYLENSLLAAAYGAAIGVSGRPREWGLTTRYRF